MSAELMDTTHIQLKPHQRLAHHSPFTLSFFTGLKWSPFTIHTLIFKYNINIFEKGMITLHKNYIPRKSCVTLRIPRHHQTIQPYCKVNHHFQMCNTIYKGAPSYGLVTLIYLQYHMIHLSVFFFKLYFKPYIHEM